MYCHIKISHKHLYKKLNIMTLALENINTLAVSYSVRLSIKSHKSCRIYSEKNPEWISFIQY